MLTAHKLHAHLLIDTGLIPQQYIILDQTYRLPTEAWLYGEFTQALERNLRGLQRDGYAPETNDCDDFAFFAHSLAKMCHREAGSTLAVGVLGYLPDGQRQHHVINFAVVQIEGQLFTRFLEPQLPPRQIHLTDTEKQHAAFYLI